MHSMIAWCIGKFVTWGRGATYFMIFIRIQKMLSCHIIMKNIRHLWKSVVRLFVDVCTTILMDQYLHKLKHYYSCVVIAHDELELGVQVWAYYLLSDFKWEEISGTRYGYTYGHLHTSVRNFEKHLEYVYIYRVMALVWCFSHGAQGSAMVTSFLRKYYRY